MFVSLSEISKLRQNLRTNGCSSPTSIQYQDFILQYIISNCNLSTLVIEVGVYQGGLTCQLAYLASCLKFKLVGLDISLDCIVKTKFNLKKNNCFDFATVLKMELKHFLREHVNTYDSIVVIVDGDHRYAGCLEDCNSLKNISNKLKAVFFHDYSLKNAQCSEINVYSAIHDVFGNRYPIVSFGDNVLFKETTVPIYVDSDVTDHYFTGSEAAAIFFK